MPHMMPIERPTPARTSDVHVSPDDCSVEKMARSVSPIISPAIPSDD